MAMTETSPTTGFPVLTPAQLSEYDFFLLIDQSGSMGEPSTKLAGKNRWQEAEELARSIASFCAEVDDDGVDIITFNANPTLFAGITPEKVHDVFTTVSPYGSTMTAKALEMAVNMHFSKPKKSFIVCITDGEAGDKPECVKTIINAVNRLNEKKELTFLFVQIGHDRSAAEFLDYLDDELEKKGAKFDCVDSIKADLAEQMTPGQMFGKAQND